MPNDYSDIDRLVAKHFNDAPNGHAWCTKHDILLDAGQCKGCQFVAELVKLLASIEKAYGGCHNCYGKGYATTLDFTHGQDTDWDIGGNGAVIHEQNPIMRYCSCDRGTQLANLIEQEKADRIAKNKSFCGCPMCLHHTGPYQAKKQ